MSDSTATVTIKGRNELTYAVRQAEQSLKGLLKQGELIGKLFRGGAIVGAIVAFERLAENAQKAAEAIGDKGTARSLRQLNREIDTLKAKGLNVIGRVIGTAFGLATGDEITLYTERLKSLRNEIEKIIRFQGGGNRANVTGGSLERLEYLENLVRNLEANRPSGLRDRAPGSRGGGRSVVLSEPAAAGKAGKIDPMAGLSELTVWQRELFDFSTMANEWADQFSTRVTNQIVKDVNVIANETRVMTTVIEEAQEPLSQMSIFAEQAARNMQDVFADWFVTMDNGFKGLLGSFTDMLRRMVAQLLAQEILTSFFSWGAGLGGGAGKFFGGLLGGIQGRAVGGPVTGGTPYLVGEKGPELFVPGMSGSIIPNGGGGGVVVNNYVTINDETDLRRSMPAIMAETTRQSVAAAKAEIRGDISRYGRIR